jgi:hypothetical protein
MLKEGQSAVMFSKGTSKSEKLLMRLQSIVTKTKGLNIETYSHVSFLTHIDGETVIVETHPAKGIVTKKFQENNTEREIRILKYPPHNYTNYIVRLNTQNQLSSNYGAVLLQGIKLFTGIRLGKKQREDKVYCSAYVAYILYYGFNLNQFKNYNSKSILDIQLSDIFE